MVEQLNLEARKAELLAKVMAAAQAGDLDLVANIGREIASLGKAVRVEVDKATESIRAEAKDNLVKALTTREFQASLRDALRQSVVSVVVRRTETGLDDGKASIAASQVYDVLMPCVQEHVASVSSIRRVEVSITNGVPKVEVFTTSGTSTKAASRSSNGTGPKGWTKDGIAYRLGDIFEAVANPDQKAEYKAFEKNGNKEYALKKAVATKAGYVQS